MLAETLARIGPLDRAAMAAAEARLAALTKPPGSLGRLEQIAIQLAGITGHERPSVDQRVIYIFAADHGITAEGVSAYPSAVTAQMVGNFLRGGAAINALARQAGARLIVADLGVASDLEPHPQLISCKIARGTRNFAREPAMTREEAVLAIETGIRLFQPCQLAGLGEMGIGNTTSAAAIVAATTGKPAAEVAGRGTGLDPSGVAHKAAVIERALARHRPDALDGLSLVEAVGGFEIAALAGAMFAAAAARVPVVIDGFISTAAALVAARLSPALRPYLIAAHCSAERGHALALSELGLEPLLNLGLCLGEGTGAALAFPLIEAACRTLAEMSTFDEARVSGPLPVSGLLPLGEGGRRPDEGLACQNDLAPGTGSHQPCHLEERPHPAATLPPSPGGRGVSGRRVHGGAGGLGLLDFSVSLNPLGPPDSLAPALAAEHAANYPEPESATLRGKLAALHGVSPEQVLVTNGACEAIELVMSSLRPRRIVVLAPAFTEYEDAARAWGHKVVTLAAREQDGFRWDFRALDAYPDDLVVLGNPANPTGILSELPQLDATLLVDETFIDFAEPATSAAGRPRTLVIRSFTKLFACPGLRLGYIVGDVAALAAHQPAWSVSRLAQAAGEAVLGEKEYREFTRHFVRERREELMRGLASMPGVKVFPSAANFLLLRVPQAGATARRLREQGIVVRLCDSFTGLAPDSFLRVAVRKRSDNQRLIEALHAAR